jgi:hypothetical protein
MKLLIMQPSLACYFSSHLGLNVFFNTPFSNILSMSSSLHVEDYVLRPYKTTGKIIVLYILIFMF